MTIEQALEIKQDWTAEQARNDLERWLLRGERPADKVIALACKALEKQIPKKPIGDLHSVPHYRCPSCKNAVKVYEDDAVRPQCHYCNQKLDWGDTK